MKFKLGENNLCFVGSLPLLGAWIEMKKLGISQSAIYSRSPCWERGLKSAEEFEARKQKVSLPLLGAWIEMFKPILLNRCWVSLPLLGAWIEIVSTQLKISGGNVAPPAGSVD